MKLKTHKMTAKKIKVTKAKKRNSKKYISKRAGQDHFNARETGKVGRNKRRKTNVSKTNIRTIKASMPYS